MTYKYLVSMFYYSFSLFHLHFAFDNCNMKSARLIKEQTQCDYSNCYSNYHEIEVRDK